MPLRRRLIAAEDVAAADHQALLDALAVHALHLARELVEGRRVVAEIAVAHQRLAGHLQQHPAKPWRSLARSPRSLIAALISLVLR